MIQRLPERDPNKPFRLMRCHIEQYANDCPRIEMIDGREVPVDATGLILPGRVYQIGPPPQPGEVENAIAWCKLAERIKTPLRCSYGCKHVAERWAGDYISNGALIIAASRVGIRMLPGNRWYWQSPNALLGIGLRWYRWQRDEQGKLGVIA